MDEKYPLTFFYSFQPDCMGQVRFSDPRFPHEYHIMFLVYEPAAGQIIDLPFVNLGLIAEIITVQYLLRVEF